MSGLFSRKDVPFEIIDWDTFVFTDRNFIYKIDDQWWQQPKEKIILDRSVSHMISWQNVDYSKENIKVLENRLSTPFCNFEKATKELMIHQNYLDKMNELEGVDND